MKVLSVLLGNKKSINRLATIEQHYQASSQPTMQVGTNNLKKMLSKKRNHNSNSTAFNIDDPLDEVEDKLTFWANKVKINKDDPDEQVEVSSEIIATEMLAIGVRLDPVTEHIPRFKLCLPTINFPVLIVKALFYMLCE
jgi:hypothetical protein